MPLTPKGRKILKSMERTYGERGTRVFYASANKGRITGVEKSRKRSRSKARRRR